jgi:hypothetical protein
MKKIFFIVALVITVISGIIFTGYQSKSKKHDAAHTERLLASRDMYEARKPVDPREWETFKRESELKIIDLENQITVLNKRIENQEELFDEFYRRTVNFLEEKNKFMKITLNNLEEVPNNWDSFKYSFSNDMEVTEKTLQELTSRTVR